MKTTYLIQSTYGFQGSHKGVDYLLRYSGTALWSLEHDGTPEDIADVLRNAQASSNQVRDFEAYCRYECDLPPSCGSWLVFSVIDKFEEE